jgi:primosomal protein N' (replication factor Y)
MCSWAARGPQFAPFLLDGVTGSGKTECYFEAVAEAIRLGRQVLVLLPEIALTQNFLRRFERASARRRCCGIPASSERAAAGVARDRLGRGAGRGRRALGAVPALCALGLIVVDEAHEVSFKQDDGVRYNARDVAVIRARFEACR